MNMTNRGGNERRSMNLGILTGMSSPLPPWTSRSDRALGARHPHQGPSTFGTGRGTRGRGRALLFVPAFPFEGLI
jgi:hypothetical protein